MGRVSKELKALGEITEKKKKKVEKAWPVANVDYHLVKVMYGEMTPPAYIYDSLYRMSRVDIIYHMDQFRGGGLLKNGGQTLLRTRRWYLVPGPKPDPKWGPVCP